MTKTSQTKAEQTSPNNLIMWNKVSASDPASLKPVAFGSRKFTAIDPHYQIRAMTEQFGIIGHGWGWSNEMEFVNFSNGDTACVAHITVWTVCKLNTFGPFTGCRTFFNSAKGRTNEDAPKMAITDGLTKAISHLGFNADVFLGQMDGNKYTADQKNKRPNNNNNDGEW
tara:strand:+ start:279 stop:785 length:507 start_codon:yes stop_codon:yes gene_type:complete